MKEELAAKLRPDRFSEMSGKMTAIVGYILDEPFSEPAISELVVTADGLEPPGSTLRIVLPEWIKLALRRTA